ncbi:MAG: hypothetical protein BGO31_10455 [Bacteroidetes bacterium 43-16]|nr:MAG: hypothetical protein BGO31_10455 [Bacteroidetes bacterium 43-16]
MMPKLLFILCILLGLWSCEATQDPVYPPHLSDCYRLHELTEKKDPARPGEWLYNKPGDMHQSLKAYIASGPYRTDSLHKKLYLVKIGAFDADAQAIFELTVNYLADYFQIDTDTIPALDAGLIPHAFKRIHQGVPQLKSIYILDSLLPHYKPADAFALIAFTSTDLYPEDDWNFVFGQAKLRNGLGVWSLARLGKEGRDNPSNQTLLRALKIAGHETGHMFSMPHCVNNVCNMNGSNSLAENDRQPEWLCWECLAKLCYNRNISPQKHLEALRAFHEKAGSDAAIIRYYKTALQRL